MFGGFLRLWIGLCVFAMVCILGTFLVGAFATGSAGISIVLMVLIAAVLGGSWALRDRA